MAKATFKEFVVSNELTDILNLFTELCRQCGASRTRENVDGDTFYSSIKKELNSINCREAHQLMKQLDDQRSKAVYGTEGNRPCKNNKVLIVGAGPCGLRMAIECAFLGARVIVVEKRRYMSRNNIIHLWPFVVHDLKALGIKVFHPTFGSGAVNHIGIRRLQTVLLKTALILGVEFYAPVQCFGLINPKKDQGWTAYFRPNNRTLSNYSFDIVITADGRANSLNVVERKCLKCKQAIAITANFQNHRTKHENSMQELPGYNYIVHADFFNKIKDETKIDLENLVYYKGDTHYFVMTVKKRCLLEKRVIKKDSTSTDTLLESKNINQKALLNFCKELAQNTTGLRHTDFALNHYQQEDTAIFDFSNRYQATEAASYRNVNGYPLFIGVVGDALLEPFWPEGTGCARGFLGVMDTAWTIRSLGISSKDHPRLMSEREDTFKLLSQTTPNTLNKKYQEYTIDPKSRYGASLRYRKIQARDSAVNPRKKETKQLDSRDTARQPPKRAQPERSETIGITELLQWYQSRLHGNKENVNINNLNTAWRDGLALNLLLESYQRQIGSHYESSFLRKTMAERHQIAFVFVYRKFGISPPMSCKKMIFLDETNNLAFITYLTQLRECLHQGKRLSHFRKSTNEKYDDLRDNPPKNFSDKHLNEEPSSAVQGSKRFSALDNINKLWQSFRSKSIISPKEKPKDENRINALRKTISNGSTNNLVNHCDYDTCCVCRKPLYVIERQTAHGLVFHRQCYRCHLCRSKLYILGEVSVHNSPDPDKSSTKFYCKRHAPVSKDHAVSHNDVAYQTYEQVNGRRRDEIDDEYDQIENIYEEIKPLPNEKVVKKLTRQMSRSLQLSDDEESSSSDEDLPTHSSDIAQENRSDRLIRRASQRLIKAYRLQTSVQEASDEEHELEEQGLNLEKVLTKRDSVEACNDNTVQEYLGVVKRKQQIVHNQKKMQLEAKSLELRDSYYRQQKELLNVDNNTARLQTCEDNSLVDDIKQTRELLELLNQSLQQIGTSIA